MSTRGTVVDVFVAARLLGLRILTLDGRIVLSPTRVRTLDPVVSSTVRPRTSDRAPGDTAPTVRDAARPAGSRGDEESGGHRRPPGRLAELARRVEDNSRRLRRLRAEDSSK